jgi:hypothetical protein
MRHSKIRICNVDSGRFLRYGIRGAFFGFFWNLITCFQSSSKKRKWGYGIRQAICSCVFFFCCILLFGFAAALIVKIRIWFVKVIL